MGVPIVLYDNNTNLLTIEGVQNKVTDAYINDATVQITLKDKSRRELTGPSWPVAGSYVSGSNGNYQFTLVATAAYPGGGTGFAVLSITSGANVAEFEFPCEFAVRRKAASV